MTLEFGSELLSFVFGRGLSGTITGSTMKLQIVDSKGDLATCIFVRGTTADFKAYADQLRSKGAECRSTKLMNGVENFARRYSAPGMDSERRTHAQKILPLKLTLGESERENAIAGRHRARNE